jgi:hypothetical protein
MKLVRMVAVRDEADILEANLRWYAERGFETVAVDDGSTDGSSELLREALEQGTVASLESLEAEGYDLNRHLIVLQELAAELEPDLLLLTAADVFFEVGDGSDLRLALEEDLAAGWTVCEFKNMEFHPTDRDDPDEPDPLKRLRYYSHWDVGMHRCARWAPGIDFARWRGHKPVLPPGMEWRESPRLYVSRHYPLRSPEQIERKLGRVRPRSDMPRAHSQYLRLIHGDGDPRIPTTVLNRYAGDHRWSLEQKALPFRLTQTNRALARAHLRIEELEERLRKANE